MDFKRKSLNTDTMMNIEYILKNECLSLVVMSGRTQEHERLRLPHRFLY